MPLRDCPSMHGGFEGRIHLVIHSHTTGNCAACNIPPHFRWLCLPMVKALPV